MKKKLFGGVVASMFFVSLLLPLSIIADDPENPEITDRQFDVKLFGMFPGVPQPLVKHIDIISAWFDVLIHCLPIITIKNILSE